MLFTQNRDIIECFHHFEGSSAIFTGLAEKSHHAIGV
jgi:hypothetical protein